jgi:membrane-associated phospholipid phosphatase
MTSHGLVPETSRNSILDERGLRDHYPAMIITLGKGLLVLLIGLVAIYLSYALVDCPLSEFVEGRHVRSQLVAAEWSPLASIQDSMTGKRPSWKQLMDWPPLVSRLSPLLLLAIPFLPRGRGREVLLLAGVSIMFVFLLKGDLKLIFGRNWPMPLEGGHPEHIRQHAVGFHFFKWTGIRDVEGASSFPSGHAAIAFAMFLSVGLIFRRALPWCLLLASLESLTLVALNYHFLSDVLAGGLLGAGATLFTASLLRLPATGRAS